jgi:hypothetical protein
MTESNSQPDPGTKHEVILHEPGLDGFMCFDDDNDSTLLELEIDE